MCKRANRGVSGCESGSEARVCQPHWIEEPEAQAKSTPSQAGSENKKTCVRKISLLLLSYHQTQKLQKGPGVLSGGFGYIYESTHTHTYLYII